VSDQSHHSVSAISYEKNPTCSISDNFCRTIKSRTTFNVTHAIKIVRYCRTTISYDFYRSSDISLIYTPLLKHSYHTWIIPQKHDVRHSSLFVYIRVNQFLHILHPYNCFHPSTMQSCQQQHFATMQCIMQLCMLHQINCLNDEDWHPNKHFAS